MTHHPSNYSSVTQQELVPGVRVEVMQVRPGGGYSARSWCPATVVSPPRGDDIRGYVWVRIDGHDTDRHVSLAAVRRRRYDILRESQAVFGGASQAVDAMFDAALGEGRR